MIQVNDDPPAALRMRVRNFRLIFMTALRQTGVSLCPVSLVPGAPDRDTTRPAPRGADTHLGLAPLTNTWTPEAANTCALRPPEATPDLTTCRPDPQTGEHVSQTRDRGRGATAWDRFVLRAPRCVSTDTSLGQRHGLRPRQPQFSTSFADKCSHGHLSFPLTKPDSSSQKRHHKAF